MKKTIILLVVVLALAGATFGYMQYNKPHRNTASEEAAYALSASALFAEYEMDEAAANEKYLDKLLLVKGSIAAVSKGEDGITSLTLNTGDPMFGVSCQLLPQEDARAAALQEGDEIEVKGICTGKLMDVVLVRSIVEE